LLTTPLVFPISWYKSNLAGFSARFSTTDVRGFQAFWLMGHSRARFFQPSSGGLVYTGDLEPGVFRIDHDQAFQSTVHSRYTSKRLGWYAAWTWRYDSGLVSGEIDGFDDALELTAAQQSAIGLYCGDTFATPGRRLTGCADDQPQGAVRYRMPFDQANSDHRPPRVAPRHLHNLAIGTDNLLRRDQFKTTLRLTATNLLNRQALYNFLSPFGGTHFVAPRVLQAAIGIRF
jgi:hypothetical protein